MSESTAAAQRSSTDRSGDSTITSPATALWNQRETIAALRERFEKLSSAVGRPTDLNLYQWAEFAALALEFRPDLIVELGRGMGNSTCCFIEVANRLGGASACRVVSLCLSEDWFDLTLPRLQGIVSPEWFKPAEIRIVNLLDYDIETLLGSARRPLILWDAHGFDIAEWVICKLLPAVVDKPHRVLMHDMSDTRFEIPSPEYGETGIWKGTNATDPAFWIGTVFSRVAQAISIIDFASRNRLPLHSGAESLHAEIASDAAKVAGLRELLGDGLFSLQAHWYWFTLNEAPGPLYFPRYSVNRKSVAQQGDVEYQPEKLWREVEQSAGWRMLNAWRTMRERVAPENTWRRRLYDSLLRPLRHQSARRDKNS